MIARLSASDPANLQPSSPPDLRQVLHVINGEHYSGAERVQDLLGLTLPAWGYGAGFVSLKPGRFSESRRCVACPVFQVPMRSRFDLSCGKTVARLVREHGYELLHAHTPRSLLVASRAARLAGVPLVYHVHSPVGRDCGSWVRNRVNTWFESRLLRGCDQMICVSGSLQQYMLGLGHRADRLSVVRNGVPVRPAGLSGPVDGTWTLGTVALFRPRKGLEVLIQALAHLRRAGFRVRLLAVGPFETPAWQAEIFQLVERLEVSDMIEWTGFEKDVDTKLRQMQILVLPSLYGEGLPMVVLEAMAVGVPVVASRVEGIPEAVRDGQDGRIFEPGDSRDLAEKIGQIIANPEEWQRMGASARERQRDQLSDQSMARQVAAVYDRALASAVCFP